MAETQKEVLRVLLGTLLERKLIVRSVYDSAINSVNCGMDLPDFFGYSVCCPKEETDHGSA